MRSRNAAVGFAINSGRIALDNALNYIRGRGNCRVMKCRRVIDDSFETVRARHPACFRTPDYVRHDKGETITKRLSNFLTKIINRYKLGYMYDHMMIIPGQGVDVQSIQSVLPGYSCYMDNVTARLRVCKKGRSA
jgi:hypothetical protein